MDYISYWKEKGEYGEIRIQRMIKRKEKRKQNAPRSHRCQHCNRSFPRILELRPNPFYEEIYQKIVLERMCTDCYNDACGDI